MEFFRSYIKDKLRFLYSDEEIRSMAFLLLKYIADVPEYYWAGRPDYVFPPSTLEALKRAVDRLALHCPVQYVTGCVDFAGCRLKTDRRALIPRPETRELIEWIFSREAACLHRPQTRILDACTGCGCIAVALALKLNEAHPSPTPRVSACDLSPEALSLARENAAGNRADVYFFCADILRPLPQLRPHSFDLLVSNPPYVRESEKAGMQANVLNYEPAMALFVPDGDPLVFYRALALRGKELLVQGGRIYVEINRDLGPRTVEVFKDEAYAEVCLKQDLNGKDRFVSARWKFS